MQRGLLTTETIAAYRARLDDLRRKMVYAKQQLAALDATLDTLLGSATDTLARERVASTDYSEGQRADWTMLVAQRQARMMAELNDHALEPWWSVHGKVYFKREEYRDLNGWLLGSNKLVIAGPYAGWRVEIPAHPDKQGPGGDGQLQCADLGAAIVPCKPRQVQGARYIGKCPNSAIVSVTERNSFTRNRAARAYAQKTLTTDCPDTWNTKTSNGRVVSQKEPNSVEGVGFIFRLGTGKKLTFYIPATLVKG